MAIITKNHLVTRDIDLLRSLAEHQAALVMLSITTLDDAARRRDGAARLAARPPARRDAGTVGRRHSGRRQWSRRSIPGLTDHELPAILKAAAAAGAQTAGCIVVRLPHGVKDLFSDWLDVHAPQRKDKVLSHLRSVRSGKLNDPRRSARA